MVMATTMSWDRARLSRLAHQHLLRRRPANQLLATVGDICGLHAQVMSSAEQSAAARADGVGRETVRDALWRDRSLVKTWAMRGTLHLLPAADVPLFAAALSLRRYDLDRAWLKFHRLTAAQLGAVVDAAAEALDGRQLTRDELGREIVRITGDGRLAPVLASGWGSLLKPVAFQGQLCFGPSDGNRVTFVRPDQWIGGFERPDPHAALQELLRRFLRAYGPATVEEFGRWWGAKPKLAREALRRADGLVEVDLGAERAWGVPDAVGRRIARPRRPVVRLLPGFDPYVVAARWRGERLLAPPLVDLVYRAAGWISPVLLVDGDLAGVWEPGRARRGVVVTVSPFAPLGPAVVEGVEEEAARLAAHLGASVSLELGSPAQR
jgi:hypothetical protein